MEDKRGTKRAHSPSKKESPSPSGAKTPPPATSGSPPPMKSPSEVSSRCPRSPVFEQVVDLCSSCDEEGLIADTSRDEEFIRRLFGDLNRDFLGPPDDGKIIILNDSDKEEEEVHEEKITDVEATPSFVVRSPAPTASAADADNATKGDTTDQVIGGSSSGGDEAGLP
jgi:hypothetical protein